MLVRPPVPLSLVIVLATGLTACGADGAAVSEPARRPPSFVDVAPDVGLDFAHAAFHFDVTGDPSSMMGGGLCWIDYDGDGWLDLFVTNTWTEIEWGRWYSGDGIPTSALYRNDGGTFTDVGADAGVATELRGNGCVAADLDLDGHTDLFVTSDRANALFWNNGDGTFTEGAASAGVAADGWHSAALVGDLDGDGWPDLFVAGYADLNTRLPEATKGFPNTYRPVRDLLYVNAGPGADGRVTFREVGETLGIDVQGESIHEYGLGGAIADLDDDGDLDLYVANDTNPNRLYENVAWPGGRAADPLDLGFRLEEVEGSGTDDDNSGMGVAAGDFTMDGRLDLFVTNLGSQRHSLYANAGPALAFADATATLAVGDLGGDLTGWGATWVDIDLDTDLDLVVANGAVPVLDLLADAEPMQVLANRSADGGGAVLEDVSDDVGLDAIGPLLGRGTAVADFDNDGDPDIAVNSIASPLRLLRNDVGGRWLTVALDGFHPGARVTAVLDDGTELVRTILAGSSYLSSEDPRALFGLGDAARVAELRVRWPDGQQTVQTDVASNRHVRVEPPS